MKYIYKFYTLSILILSFLAVFSCNKHKEEAPQKVDISKYEFTVEVCDKFSDAEGDTKAFGKSTWDVNDRIFCQLLSSTNGIFKLTYNSEGKWDVAVLEGNPFESTNQTMGFWALHSAYIYIYDNNNYSVGGGEVLFSDECYWTRTDINKYSITVPVVHRINQKLVIDGYIEGATIQSNDFKLLSDKYPMDTWGSVNVVDDPIPLWNSTSSFAEYFIVPKFTPTTTVNIIYENKVYSRKYDKQIKTDYSTVIKGPLSDEADKWILRSKNPKMELITTTTIGSTMSLEIGAQEESKPNIWIDINNNGTRDTGEDVTIFSPGSQQFTLQSQTFSIYGDVEILKVSSKKITSLKVDENISLKELFCTDNKISNIDVSQNIKLETLFLYRNQITSINVTKNPKLKKLYVSDNKLKTLDVSKNNDLEELSFSFNSNISVTNFNPKLTVLSCAGTSLTSLDVSKLPLLKELICNSNNIKTLDVTSNTKLEKLICLSCGLKELDLSKNPSLKRVNCCYNSIREDNAYKLINSLVNRSSASDYAILDFFVKSTSESNMCTKGDVKIAFNKKWKVLVAQESTPIDFNGLYSSYEVKVDATPGSNFYFDVQGSPQELNDIFVDLNGNGLKDSGEGITKYGNTTFTLGNLMTFNIYGNFKGLGLTQDKLTQIKVIDQGYNDSYLNYLNCAQNKMKDLGWTHLANSLITVRGTTEGELVYMDENGYDENEEIDPQNQNTIGGKNWKIIKMN